MNDFDEIEMETATDLLVIFIALEILSLAVYILTGIRRDSKTGAEAQLSRASRIHGKTRPVMLFRPSSCAAPPGGERRSLRRRG